MKAYESLVTAIDEPTHRPANGLVMLGKITSRLPPDTVALLRQHFWCDFSNVVPSMAWDDVEFEQ